jgi:hypothetical protein
MERTTAAHDLQRLLDVLVSTRRDLSEGLMPRAARITGTGEQLARVISRVEAAIHTTKSLLAEQERGGPAIGAGRGADVALEESPRPVR